MIGDRKILGVIPARGGSKGLPGKNLRMAGGKPLLAWTLEAASGSRYLDRLILSSEDKDIIASGRSLGLEVPFVRPAELAGDEVSAVEPVIHALEQLPGYDYVVLLQPTTPLRSKNDIDGCIELCFERNADAVISVTAVKQNPFWMFQRQEDGRLSPLMDRSYLLTQRQGLPDVFYPNGAVYVAGTDYFFRYRTFSGERTYGFEMPRERSVDIDDEKDLAEFERIVQRYGLCTESISDLASNREV